MDCIAIIPARFSATRFPGKLLASVAGRPLIQHVIEGVSGVRGIDAVVVATDDERIAAASRDTGVDVVMSSGDFASGTDRVADAAERFQADVIVNVQGDELLLEPAAVAEALDVFRRSESGLGTLRAPLAAPQDLWDPNVVKVVVDDNERAVYFSRSPIPFPRGAWQASAADTKDTGGSLSSADWWPRLAAATTDSPAAWVHLGVYFYRAAALRRWAALSPSALEVVEGLEQLRVLEAGETMQTYLVNEAIPGVNTPSDLERASAALAARAERA